MAEALLKWAAIVDLVYGKQDWEDWIGLDVSMEPMDSISVYRDAFETNRYRRWRSCVTRSEKARERQKYR